MCFIPVLWRSRALKSQPCPGQPPPSVLRWNKPENRIYLKQIWCRFVSTLSCFLLIIRHLIPDARQTSSSAPCKHLKEVISFLLVIVLWGFLYALLFSDCIFHHLLLDSFQDECLCLCSSMTRAFCCLEFIAVPIHDCFASYWWYWSSNNPTVFFFLPAIKDKLFELCPVISANQPLSQKLESAREFLVKQNCSCYLGHFCFG